MQCFKQPHAKGSERSLGVNNGASLEASFSVSARRRHEDASLFCVDYMTSSLPIRPKTNKNNNFCTFRCCRICDKVDVVFVTDEAEEQDGGTGDGDGADALLRVESDAGQRAGQGRAGQGRAGQGRAGQGKVECCFVCCDNLPTCTMICFQTASWLYM